MTVLQNQPLNQDTIKTRWREPYVTAGLNQKAVAGDTRGVVLGFKVVPSSGYSVQIQPDPTLNISVANVLDSSGNFSLTLLQSGPLYLDLTAQAGTTVFIALDAQYAVGTNSTAQLKVVDAAELLISPDLVLLAKVSVPATPIPGPPIAAADINLGYALLSGDSISEQAKPRTNLVFNPDFDTGNVNGWVFLSFSSAAASTDTARSGAYSLKLTRVSPATALATSGPMPVVPGRKYRVSAWLRSVGSDPIVTGNGARLLLSWRNASDVEISYEGVEGYFTGGGTTFEERKSEVTAPALATHARVEVLFDGCQGTLYVDDVEFSHPRADSLARSPVFGGSGVLADLYHTHTAAGMSYAGGPSWADGTLNSGAGYPSTIEAQIDKMLSDLSGASGAPKVGNAPSKILPNTFTVTGAGGLGVPISAYGGSAINTPAGLFVSQAGTAGPGLQGVGSGTGAGLEGYGGLSNNSYGGYFTSNSTIGNGVLGQGVATGVGVEGRGGVNTASFGGPTLNPPVPGPGNGGTFMGATGAAGGDGLQAFAQGTSASRSGILAVGAYPTLAGTPGGAGGVFYGGAAAPTGNTAGGHGIIGNSGAAVGSGSPGDGVRGLGGSNVGGIGVRGISGPIGVGVQGEGTGPFSVGVRGISPSSNNTSGVFGQGTAGFNTVGVAGTGGGLGSGGSFQGGELGGVGVVGNGTGVYAGVAGTGATTGSGVTGTGGGTSGSGVVGTGGGPNGYGVRGVGTGTGIGVAGLANGATTTQTNIGVQGKGNTGGWFESTQTNGTSLYIPVPLGNSTGIEAQQRGTGWALDCYNASGGTASDLIRAQGNVKLSGDHLNGNVARTSILAPNNLIKACCQIQLNNTTTPEPTAATLATNLSSAFNITSVAQNLGTARITVTFASAFANATDWFALITFENNYGGTVRALTAQTDPAGPPGAGKSATSYTFMLYDGITGVGLTAAQENGLRINFVAIGRQ